MIRDFTIITILRLQCIRSKQIDSAISLEILYNKPHKSQDQLFSEKIKLNFIPFLPRKRCITSKRAHFLTARLFWMQECYMRFTLGNEIGKDQWSKFQHAFSNKRWAHTASQFFTCHYLKHSCRLGDFKIRATVSITLEKGSKGSKAQSSP